MAKKKKMEGNTQSYISKIAEQKETSARVSRFGLGFDIPNTKSPKSTRVLRVRGKDLLSEKKRPKAQGGTHEKCPQGTKGPSSPHRQ